MPYPTYSSRSIRSSYSDDSAYSDYPAYSLDELSAMLDIQTVLDALSAGRIYPRNEDYEDLEICFPHAGDPDCEFSYISICTGQLRWDSMSDEGHAALVAESMISLVQDDPDIYADEISFYTDLLTARI